MINILLTLIILSLSYAQNTNSGGGVPGPKLDHYRCLDAEKRYTKVKSQKHYRFKGEAKITHLEKDFLKLINRKAKNCGVEVKFKSTIELSLYFNIHSSLLNSNGKETCLEIKRPCFIDQEVALKFLHLSQEKEFSHLLTKQMIPDGTMCLEDIEEQSIQTVKKLNQIFLEIQ